MKKLAGILAIVLLAGTMLSNTDFRRPVTVRRPRQDIFFKPTAKFKPSNDVKADNHVWFHFTNTDTRDHKFIGVITNLGPSDENNDWEIVQYCFSDACYPPLVGGRTTGNSNRNGVRHVRPSLLRTTKIQGQIRHDGNRKG